MSKHCAERGEICVEPRVLPSAADVGGPEQSRGEKKPFHEQGAEILDFRTLLCIQSDRFFKTWKCREGECVKNESDPQEVASFLTDQFYVLM